MADTSHIGRELGHRDVSRRALQAARAGAVGARGRPGLRRRGGRRRGGLRRPGRPPQLARAGHALARQLRRGHGGAGPRPAARPARRGALGVPRAGARRRRDHGSAPGGRRHPARGQARRHDDVRLGGDRVLQPATTRSWPCRPTRSSRRGGWAGERGRQRAAAPRRSRCGEGDRMPERERRADHAHPHRPLRRRRRRHEPDPPRRGVRAQRGHAGRVRHGTAARRHPVVRRRALAGPRQRALAEPALHRSGVARATC